MEWNGTVYDDMGTVDQNEISSSVHTVELKGIFFGNFETRCLMSILF